MEPSCEKAEGAGRMSAHSIWHKPCPIVGGGGARETFAMPTFAEALVSQELTLSFVPPAEQRLWRT